MIAVTLEGDVGEDFDCAMEVYWMFHTLLHCEFTIPLNQFSQELLWNWWMISQSVPRRVPVNKTMGWFPEAF